MNKNGWGGGLRILLVGLTREPLRIVSHKDSTLVVSGSQNTPVYVLTYRDFRGFPHHESKNLIGISIK